LIYSNKHLSLIKSTSRHHEAWVKNFLIASWCHMLFLTHPYFTSGFEGRILSTNAIFHLAVWPLYSLLYLLPVFIPVWVFQRFFPCRQLLCKVLANILSSILLLFIWSDSMVFDLYSFHINSFVMNLVLTTGGIDSLNSSSSTYFSIIVEVIRIVSIQALLLLISSHKNTAFIGLYKIKALTIVKYIFFLFLVESISYGIADVTNNASILDHAYNYPFFQKTRFRSLAAKLGFENERRDRFAKLPDKNRLVYPLQDITFDNDVHTPNIIWLVAESMRWDQLSPETMPNTWNLANNSWNFKNHYSSGNGTREGMFGMFYGLYGSYWDSFLHAEQSPLLIDRMQELEYDFNIRTGAKFTYPEFDRTILSNLQQSSFFEADEDLSPWQRDSQNAAALISFIRQEHDHPFMAFQFFESTHAPYFFPDDHALKQPYPDSLNYADFSKKYLEENISGILNRYRNAGHWVDSQVGMIIEALSEQGLEDDTIIIFTGDHGEEFMEKGGWGHNSTFVEEQTHVPFILHLPGKMPRTVSALTSHLDVPTTLLSLLGSKTDSSNYTLGVNLLESWERDAIIISDWHSIDFVARDMKIRIPYKSTGFDNWKATDINDKILNSEISSQLLSRYQLAITQAMENNSLFAN